MTDNQSRSLRLLIAFVGGYFFVNGCVALLGIGLPLLGLEQSEASQLAILLGIVLYLATVIWIVSTAKLRRDGVLLISLAGTMILAALYAT